jgi:SAM-dependent methyltransferase
VYVLVFRNSHEPLSFHLPVAYVSARAFGFTFLLSLALFAFYEHQSLFIGQTTFLTSTSKTMSFSNSSTNRFAELLRPPGHPIGVLLCDQTGASILDEKTVPGSEFNEASLAGVAGRFKEIYERSQWGAEGAGSGMGSTLEQTGTLRVIIEMLIYRYAVTSFLDAPCGSAHWWKPLLARVRENIPCFRYHGVDVAPLAIERASELHAGDGLTSFELGDVSRTPLPVGVGLALCRDAMQHLPMAEAVRLLRNLAAARPLYALLGSYSSEHANTHISVGDYYPINLQSPPFNLPPPLADFDERTPVIGQASKHLLLYSGEQLRGIDWDTMLELIKRL